MNSQEITCSKKFSLSPIQTKGKPGILTEINLTKICLENNLEFIPVKYFYVTDLDSTESRGNHSNKNASEILICLQGSFNIKLHDGKEEKEFIIKQHEGIYINKNIWISYYNFKNCVILACVNIYPNLKECCYNIDEFLKDTF